MNGSVEGWEIHNQISNETPFIGKNSVIPSNSACLFFAIFAPLREMQIRSATVLDRRYS